MRLCLHTLGQKRFFMLPWSWNPCSSDGGSHCFCTSNSRGKNPCTGFIPLGFQISSCLFSCSEELSLSLSLFLNLLFVRFTTMEAAGKLILVFVKSVAETWMHVWSVSFLSKGPLPSNRVCDLITSKGSWGEMQNVNQSTVSKYSTEQITSSYFLWHDKFDINFNITYTRMSTFSSRPQ